jgi:hypothetical protein
MRLSFIRSAGFRSVIIAALAGTTISLGHVVSPLAQSSPGDDKARCKQLYDLWSRYNGRESYSTPAGADIALEDCRKGNTAAGIASLTKALQRRHITVPPTESASRPQ